MKRLPRRQCQMLAVLLSGPSIGMCREEWHARCRELGLGVTRSATLTEVRHKLEKKGLVKHVGWTYVASRMPTGRSFCTRFVCTECGLLGAYIPPDLRPRQMPGARPLTQPSLRSI